MIAVLRVRGSIGTNRMIKDTFRLLRLHAANHLVLLPETPSGAGMARKVRNHAAYGSISAETLAKTLEKRGRLEGNRRITRQDLEKMGFKEFDDMAKALECGKSTFKKLGIKPVFRLRPPKKGFERQGIKKTFKEGGALGFRGEAMDELVKKMI